MKLYNRQGDPVDVPDDQVQSAFQSGEFGLPKGTRIPVVMGGVLGSVPSDKLGDAFENKATLATPEEIHKGELEEKYGGVAGGAAAAGIGAARGLTVGLSDPLAVGTARAFGGDEAAEKTRAYLEGVKEQHPIASTAGEIAGVVAPALLSGGAAAGVEAGVEGANLARVGAEGVEGATALADTAKAAGAVAKARNAVAPVAKVLGAPVHAITEAGGAVERAVAKVVGTDAAGLAGRIGQKIATKGASAAVESALFNVGSEISESTFGDTDLTGEKLLIAAGHGALLGGAFGAGVGAAGELGRAVLGRVAPQLSKIAEEQAFKSINARKAFTNEANKIPGGTAAVGRRLLDEGIVAAGDTVEQMAPKVTEARAGAGKAIGKMLEQADAAGMAGPKLQTIFDRVEDDVLKELSVMGATNSGAVAKVTSILTDLKNFAGVEGTADMSGARLTFKGAQEFRTRLDDLIKWNTNPMAPVNETTVAMKGIRNAIEGELVNAGEESAAKMGGSFKAEYESAKLRYRQLAVADKAAQDAVDRAQANASHSLTDKIYGAAGVASGFAHAGPLGAMGGLLAGQASKIVRTRGNSTAAVMLDKLSAISGVERAAQTVDREIDRGVAGFFGTGKRVPPKVRFRAISGGEDSKKEYQARVEAVAKSVAAADGHADGIASKTADLQAHAPETSAAFQRTALTATAYLAQQIPAGHKDFRSLQPQFQTPRVSDSEEYRFNRVFDAVHDPTTVLESMAKGRVSHDQVEAVKAVYPKLFAEMQTKVVEHLHSMKAPLAYDKRVQLGILLDVPTDATLDPDFIKTMQANFAGEDGNSKEGASAPTAPKRSMGDMSASMQLPGQSLK